MRILNLCETARGGVGIYQRFLSAMNGAEFEHHHLVPYEHSDFMGDLPNTHHFHRPARGLRASANMLRAFGALVREIDPDICFFHSTFALAGLSSLRLRRDHRPTIYSSHGWAIATEKHDSLKGRAIRAVEGRLIGLADRVVCDSAADEELARSLGYRGRLLTIENAVPDAAADARADLFADEPDRLHLLFVGRLDRQKGFDILAEALRRLRREDLVVHVIGGTVRGDAEAPEVPPGARMAGWIPRERLDDWYRSADALVVPSRWEGLPLVIPDALANGTPVICSERSGMERLIERGTTGEHFPLDPGALAALLESLDKKTLRSMRPACKAAHARRFSIARLHDELAALFRELAGQKA